MNMAHSGIPDKRSSDGSFDIPCERNAAIPTSSSDRPMVFLCSTVPIGNPACLSIIECADDSCLLPISSLHRKVNVCA